jgi:hypothetical protein
MECSAILDPDFDTLLKRIDVETQGQTEWRSHSLIKIYRLSRTGREIGHEMVAEHH